MLIWWLKKLLFGIALLFVVLTAQKLAQNWDSSTVRLDPLWLGLSFPVAVVACELQSVAFRRLVGAWMGHPTEARVADELFFASQLARYTPGRLGLIAVRIARASELRVPKEQMAAITFGEVLIWLVSGTTALALAVSQTQAKALGAYLSLSALSYLATSLLFGAAVALCTVPRRAWANLLGPRLTARFLVASGNEHAPLLPVSATLLVFAHWLMWILHGSLLGLSVGMPHHLFTFSGTALLLSIFAGFFSFFAPAGVGVREAALAYALAPWVGSANATLVGVLARAASLAAEVLLYAVAKARSIKAAQRAPRPTAGSVDRTE